ncbi:MAG TPA: helix-turn-helix domain-containing protein [Kofleriaceae bacterium]|nr:helix-turn-helix domain-containing protein [Kofleriaceae bacterium]
MSHYQLPMHDVCYAGARVWVWRRDPSLWITVLWDAPNADDVRAMARAQDPAFDRDDAFESLVDLGGVTVVDPLAFEAMAAFARRRRDGFERLIRKQALVRPPGMIGAMVTGFFESEGFSMPVRAFDDRASALAWLRPDHGLALAREVDARLAPVAPILIAVRAKLVETSAIGACARALGVSVRTLQRQLRDAGTSFRAEVTRARLEVAMRLLQSPDAKLAAIALEVGFATSQAFAAAFRAHTGETPSAWRATRLRAASPAACAGDPTATSSASRPTSRG